MVRHGYSNCITCHVSPTGGGIMTEYGRQLSREVLSTWGVEGEEKFIFGTTPGWLALQGELRTVNVQTENAGGIKDDDLILMQADLEAAVTLGQWTAVGTVGRLDTAVYPNQSDWISRRHYLMYRPQDEWSIRAGRFSRAYGINIDNHFTVIRDGLNWGPGTETYALEGAYLGEKYNVYATADFGRPDESDLDREAGAAVSGSAFFANRYKVGASYFYGSSDLAKRHLFGPWAMLGFTSRFFLLSELDFQRNFAYDFAEPQWGLANYNRLDFEPIQGIHAFGTAEVSRLNFSDESTSIVRYGLGIQWFPRPHFEFQASWQTEQQLAIDREFRPILWLMLHYYL